MLHPDLDAFKGPGGLFDTGLTDLHADIGRRCVFIAPGCEYRRDIFTIVGVQRIYTGEIAYRVVGDKEVHKFGCPAREGDVRFI